MKRSSSLISSFCIRSHVHDWTWSLTIENCNRIQSPYGQPLSCMYVDTYVHMYMWAVIWLWLNFSCHFSFTCFTKFSWSPQVPTMFSVSVPTLCIYVSASVVRVLESAPDNSHVGTCPFTQWVWNLDSQFFLEKFRMFFSGSSNIWMQLANAKFIPLCNKQARRINIYIESYGWRKSNLLLPKQSQLAITSLYLMSKKGN
jgi:hypothetical protein